MVPRNSIQSWRASPRYLRLDVNRSFLPGGQRCARDASSRHIDVWRCISPTLRIIGGRAFRIRGSSAEAGDRAVQMTFAVRLTAHRKPVQDFVLECCAKALNLLKAAFPRGVLKCRKRMMTLSGRTPGMVSMSSTPAGIWLRCPNSCSRAATEDASRPVISLTSSETPSRQLATCQSAAASYLRTRLILRHARSNGPSLP